MHFGRVHLSLAARPLSSLPIAHRAFGGEAEREVTSSFIFRIIEMVAMRRRRMRRRIIGRVAMRTRIIAGMVLRRRKILLVMNYAGEDNGVGDETYFGESLGER